jgi:hypothetical protein
LEKLANLFLAKQEFEQAGFFFQFSDLKNLAKLVKFTPPKKKNLIPFFSPPPIPPPPPQKKQQQNV